MLSFPQPSLDDKSTELIEELPEGVIHLRLRPAPQSPGRVTIEPGIGFIDNTEERIRYALAKKRRQVRQSQSPVLLAIEGSGLSSDLEDFDKALFGRTFGRVNLQGEEVERGFQSDGEFMKQKNKPPTYAGVLAFVEVGFAYVADPVLYLHPRFAGALPEPILGLERRSYDPQGNMVRIEPAQLVNLSRGLHLVQR